MLKFLQPTKNQFTMRRDFEKTQLRKEKVLSSIDYKKKSTILNRYVNLLDLENSDLNYLLLKNKRPDPYRRF
jgi:hypothetical protein